MKNLKEKLLMDKQIIKDIKQIVIHTFTIDINSNKETQNGFKLNKIEYLLK